MTVPFEFESCFSSRVNIQGELCLQGVEGAGPLYPVAGENVSPPAEAFEPAALLVSRQQVVAETRSIQVSGRLFSDTALQFLHVRPVS